MSAALVLGCSQNLFWLPVLDRTAKLLLFWCQNWFWQTVLLVFWCQNWFWQTDLLEFWALICWNSGHHSPLLDWWVRDRLVGVIWLQVSLVGMWM